MERRTVLAGLATGTWSGLPALEALWAGERRFDADMTDEARAPLVAGWHDALRRTLSKPEPQPTR